MTATSQHHRITMLLFAGGMLISAALVASQITEGNAANAQATTIADEGPAFDDWASQDPSLDERKGKFLGMVERNGEMVEVREALPEQGLEPVDEAEAGAERAEPAPR